MTMLIHRIKWDCQGSRD